jgi:ABC-type sugar transport system ATPase subunit
MISSDMPELVAMSDRIIVMRNGKASALLEKDAINQETVLKHAIGVA